ncbi:MAG: peptidoglycan-binding protein [Verrucomicrobia bacterium]|nr:peptidoglycan-binding protein [Verrucomicrobiota bacterium]
MPLNSAIFKGTAPNARLEQAAVGPPPIKAAPPADDVEAVRRIQRALVALGHPLPKSFPNGPNKEPDGKYGEEVFQAVLAFQRQAFTSSSDQDGRCGKTTLTTMDAVLVGAAAPLAPIDNSSIIAEAKKRSRASAGVVLRRMSAFEAAIDAANQLDGAGKAGALTTLRKTFARDIAIIADKLRTSKDPLSKEFRSTLASVRQLVQNNINATSSIIDEGTVGRCDASQNNPPEVPFAATTRVAPDPRVSVCTPFFAENDDMQRDVITHEFFHLLGVGHAKNLNSTADALDDANTLAQVVAYMHDRKRTRDSSGFDQPRVVYPSP